MINNCTLKTLLSKACKNTYKNSYYNITEIYVQYYQGLSLFKYKVKATQI